MLKRIKLVGLIIIYSVILLVISGCGAKNTNIVIPNSNEVIAIVNNYSITGLEFNKTKVGMEFSKGKEVSNDEVLKLLIKRKALVEEAKNRGIHISDDEVQDYVGPMTNMMEKIEDENVTVETSFATEFFKAMGYDSENNYWSDPEVLQRYKDGMYIGRLRDILLSDILLEKGKSIEDYMTLPSEDILSITPVRNEYETFIEQRMESIVNDANIKIIFSGLK